MGPHQRQSSRTRPARRGHVDTGGARTCEESFADPTRSVPTSEFHLPPGPGSDSLSRETRGGWAGAKRGSLWRKGLGERLSPSLWRTERSERCFPEGFPAGRHSSPSSHGFKRGLCRRSTSLQPLPSLEGLGLLPPVLFPATSGPNSLPIPGSSLHWPQGSRRPDCTARCKPPRVPRTGSPDEPGGCCSSPPIPLHFWSPHSLPRPSPSDLRLPLSITPTVTQPLVCFMSATLRCPSADSRCPSAPAELAASAGCALGS